MGVDHLKELKRLQKESGQLRRVVSDQTLDKLILKEAANQVWSYDFVHCRTDGGTVYQQKSIGEQGSE